MSENKTHYRKVFKSDHLGSADLEEMIEQKKRLVFTISNVTQHMKDPAKKGSGVSVAGKMISANIAHFTDGTKPLVLNAKNSKQVSVFAKSKFVNDWNNILIELYIDHNVKYAGEVVGGVRISPNQPKVIQPELTPAHKNWDKAKEGVKQGVVTKESISKNWTITDENYDLLCS